MSAHDLYSCSQPRTKGSPQPVRLKDASVNESKKRPPGLENAFHILILKRDYRAPAITGLNLYPYSRYIPHGNDCDDAVGSLILLPGVYYLYTCTAEIIHIPRDQR